MTEPDTSQLKENEPELKRLKLERNRFCEDGIFGTLSEGDKSYGFTLEHSYDNKPKLPDGVYRCVRHAPNRLPYETFEVTGVPGHEGILIHVGNYNSDSEGCILLGLAENAKMVLISQKAFDALMLAMAGVDSFELEVTSAYTQSE